MKRGAKGGGGEMRIGMKDKGNEREKRIEQSEGADQPWNREKKKKKGTGDESESNAPTADGLSFDFPTSFLR